MMIRWWRRRQAYAALVRAQADELIAEYGDRAYSIARDVRRLTLADAPNNDYWRAVAKEVARRQGHEVGLDTATRYLER